MAISFGKPVIIISAWNEEKYIGRTLDLVKEALEHCKIDAEVIVINDGSTDRTSEIAKSKGIKVIDLPKNVGKANAFFAGVKEALKTNPVCVVTLDADMLYVPSESLKLMINEAYSSTSRKKTKMFIAGDVKEGRIECTPNFTGIRSFSLWGLYKLIRSPIKKYPKGFGLEYFLNFFFSGKRFVEGSRNNFYSENIGLLREASFVCANAHREYIMDPGPRKEKQIKELGRTRDTLSKKFKALSKMRERRMK